jgi:RNA polymerase sigma factor (sigma-70 family)
MKVLDYLASKAPEEQQSEHPLQRRLEEIIETELTEHEREIFHLRFGEMLSFREIADVMGYDSHQTFHYQVEKIMRKVVDALER